MAITAEAAEKIGGRPWTSGNGKISRVYINNDVLVDVIGLEVTYYGTGNVRGATLNDEAISNAEANRILASKVYVDGDGLHVETSARSITAADVEAAIARRIAELEA